MTTFVGESQHDNENYYNAHKCNTSLAHTIANNDLSIFHLKLRSLDTGGDILITCLETLKFNFDIVCLKETRMPEGKRYDHLFPDFTPHNSYQKLRKGMRYRNLCWKSSRIRGIT